jgi:predicted dienelactone hydrolase
MNVFKFTLLSAFCLMATLVQAAGFRFITVPAEASFPMLRAAVWSPCLGPVGEVKLRLIRLPATQDCAVSGEKLPLIVISHGYGGSFASHHDTAEALADSGFVVVALNHPLDSGGDDMSRADTLTAWTERSADIRRLIDYMLTVWSDHQKLDPENIGFFGFSRGGYTGLVVAGGNPDLRKAITFCPEGSPKPICAQLRRNEIPTQNFVHDERVKALAIADPAFGPLFDSSGLKNVKIPIQLWESELSGEDETGGEVTPDYVSAIDRNLPIKADYHLVPGAGHFAFLAPCAPDLAEKLPNICSDRPGFDRVAFHREFNAVVLGFFRKNFARTDQP